MVDKGFTVENGNVRATFVTKIKYTYEKKYTQQKK